MGLAPMAASLPGIDDSTIQPFSKKVGLSRAVHLLQNACNAGMRFVLPSRKHHNQKGLIFHEHIIFKTPI